MHCTCTWEMCNFLWATSPISTEATEQAGPRIISLVGCDGSVCWVRWYNAGIDEHCNRKGGKNYS